MDVKVLEYIKKPIGDIKETDLKYVDYYASEKLCICIPSVGFCEYAIKPNHTHPGYSFVLFFHNEERFMPNTIEVLPDHFLATGLSPKMKHQEEKSDSFNRYIAIFIDKDFYEMYYRNYSNEKVDNYFWNEFLVHKEIMVYIRKYMSEFENKSSGYEELLNSLSVIITNEIIRSIIGIKARSNKVIKSFDIEDVIEYMNKNFGDKLTVGVLANYINMSESHFIRIFKEETGLSPIDYLIKLRINKGKMLIRSKAYSITEIAGECGFNSVSHFSSCFVKQNGSSPTEYKNLYT
ncbi:helix-turn-helix domain-containing protein [Clostridium sp. LP20]|uniref:helix-turn-helix domain-containing protein n=1 Tax=Clostridium sp. LP20 TaxID=3418665 RepID=UPI003EE4B056